MAEAKKPAHDFRLGPIYTAIWRNLKPDNEVWFNVTITRRFQVNGGWRETTTFRRDDLPIAAKALDMAYAWIWSQNDDQQSPTSTTPTQNRVRRNV